MSEEITLNKHELICWVAEYSYCKANDFPMGEGHKPPSIIYEQVEKDFNKWTEWLPPKGEANT